MEGDIVTFGWSSKTIERAVKRTLVIVFMGIAYLQYGSYVGVATKSKPYSMHVALPDGIEAKSHGD